MNVENGALAPCNVNEEQVQASVEVGETSTTNFTTIEIDLQKTIGIIVEQKNVTFISKPKEDERFIRHVEIDACDIFILIIINHPPPPPSLFEKMGGFIFGKFVLAIPLLNLVFKLLTHLPFPCEKVGGAFFLDLNL